MTPSVKRMMMWSTWTKDARPDEDGVAKFWRKSLNDFSTSWMWLTLVWMVSAIFGAFETSDMKGWTISTIFAAAARIPTMEAATLNGSPIVTIQRICREDLRWRVIRPEIKQGRAVSNTPPVSLGNLKLIFRWALWFSYFHCGVPSPNELKAVTKHRKSASVRTEAMDFIFECFSNWTGQKCNKACWFQILSWYLVGWSFQVSPNATFGTFLWFPEM